jgi:hypothetical protein
MAILVVTSEERFPQADSSYGDQPGRSGQVNMTSEGGLPSGRTDELPIAPSESADGRGVNPISSRPGVDIPRSDLRAGEVGPGRMQSLSFVLL